jgi:hypothetical protein
VRAAAWAHADDLVTAVETNLVFALQALNRHDEARGPRA